MTIDKARFRRPVAARRSSTDSRQGGAPPGTGLESSTGEAFVGDELCAEAEFGAMIHDNQPDLDDRPSTAIVEEGARLGGGVEIGPYCVVGGQATLCEGVRLHFSRCHWWSNGRLARARVIHSFTHLAAARRCANPIRQEWACE